MDTQPATTENTPTPSMRPLAIIVAVACVFILMILIVGGVMLYLNYSIKLTPQGNVPNLNQTNAAIFYYVDDEQTVGDPVSSLVAVSGEGLNKTVLLKSKPGETIANLSVVDNNTVGFILSESSGEAVKYKIALFDVQTNKLTTLKEINDSNLNNIPVLVWKSKTEYVYQASYVDHGTITYVTNNGVKEFKKLPPTPARGTGYMEANQRLIFSPNKDKLLAVDSSFEEAQISNTLTVFDLNGKQITEIEKAAAPLWLDNNTLIFQNTLNNGLYSYNVGQRITSLVQKMDDRAYGMRYYNNKLLYWKELADPQYAAVYLFDLTTNKEIKLVDDATEPIWLDENNILYSKVARCQGEPELTEDCTVTGYKYPQVYRKNIKTGKDELIIKPASQYLQTVVSPNDPQGFFCENLMCSD